MRATTIRRVLPLAALALLAGLLPLRASAETTALEGTRHFDHVVVLVLENENFKVTWDPQVAPYLNGLKGEQGVFLDHYYATGHASLDNYIAMVSGQPDHPLTGSDCLAVSLWVCAQPQSLLQGGRNLADQLEDSEVSWKGYMDSMPGACFHQDYSPTVLTPDPYQGDSTTGPAGNYADRHNPFLYFDDIVGDDDRCQEHVRPYSELAADIDADPLNGTLPNFSFITPDTCHDGHDATCADGSPGGMPRADQWLSEQVPPLLEYLTAHNGLLLITLDENGFTDPELPPGCCSGGLGGVLPGFGGRVGLLALGADIAHKTETASYDHMSLLRTIESSFGIGEYLNNAAQAKPMKELFTG